MSSELEIRFQKPLQLLELCDAALEPGESKQVALAFDNGPPTGNKFLIKPAETVTVDGGQKLYIYDAEKLRKKIIKEFRKLGIHVKRKKNSADNSAARSKSAQTVGQAKKKGLLGNVQPDPRHAVTPNAGN